MQKIKKANLIIALIIFIISAVIAFILIKTSTDKVKIYNSLSTFDLIMIGLAALVWTFCLVDFYKIKKDKKNAGEIKFNVSIKINKLFILSNFLMLLISICQIVLFITEGKTFSLVFAILLIPTSCTNLLRNKADNAICENGIYHWGVYHPWIKIKSYEITDNALELNFESKLLRKDYTNEVKLFFDINESDNITDFLNSKINN